MGEKVRSGQERSEPEPDAIIRLEDEGWRAQILISSVELDVFTAIDRGLRTAGRLATAKGWDELATGNLLNSLCPLGLLKKRKGVYSLTPMPRAFLSRESSTYGGDAFLMNVSPRFIGNLGRYVRTGRASIPNVSSAALMQAWREEALMESRRRTRIPQSLKMWRLAGLDPKKRRHLRILDIASGCGIKSLTMARYNPDAEVTCLDSPKVVEVAKRLAKEWRVDDRAMFIGGNLMKHEFGSGEYDAVLLGQINFFLDERENTALMKRVCRALKPGGIVMIHAPVVDEERCRSPALPWSLWVSLFSDGGGAFTFSEISRILRRAGFGGVRGHGDMLVTARKKK